MLEEESKLSTKLPKSFHNPYEYDAEYILIPGGRYKYQGKIDKEVFGIYFAKYPVTNKLYRRFIRYLENLERELLEILPKGEFDKRMTEFASVVVDFDKYLGDAPDDWPEKLRSDWDTEEYWNGEDQPVVGVSWFAAIAYCYWLSLLTAAGENFSYDKAKGLYRLPNEIEWEWAAGGGNRKYPWMPCKGPPRKKLANYNRSKVGATTPVNRYPEGATPEGLMDMAGNVWEWMENLRNEHGYDISLRGGAFYYSEYELRCTERHWNGPDGHSPGIGFRVVRSQTLAQRPLPYIVLLRPDEPNPYVTKRVETGVQPDEPSPSGWKPEYLAMLEATLKQEWQEPEAARKSYSELLRKSFETRAGVLALAVATSLIAAIVTFYLTQQLEEGRGWIAFFMLFFVGYYPPFLVTSHSASRRRGSYAMMTPNQRLFVPMIIGFVFFFEKLVFFLAVISYALVLGFPWYLLSGLIVNWHTGSPWWMVPYAVSKVIAIGSLLLGVLVAISDVDLSLAFQPRKAIPEIVAGLWHSRVWNIPLLTNIAIGVVLSGTGPLGLLYDELPLAIVALGLTGLLHGLGLYKQPYDERLYCLVWIALARTEIRKGWLGSARWRLRKIDTFTEKPPEVAHMIASALIRVANPDAKKRRDSSIAAELAKAAVAAEETKYYPRLWIASVKNSQVMLLKGSKHEKVKGKASL